MEHMEDYGIFDSSIVDSQVEAFARNESFDFSLVQTHRKCDKERPSTSSSMPRSNVEMQSVSNPTIHDSDMEDDMIGALFRNDTGDVCFDNDGDDLEQNEQDETEERLRLRLKNQFGRPIDNKFSSLDPLSLLRYSHLDIGCLHYSSSTLSIISPHS